MFYLVLHDLVESLVAGDVALFNRVLQVLLLTALELEELIFSFKQDVFLEVF